MSRLSNMGHVYVLPVSRTDIPGLQPQNPYNLVEARVDIYRFSNIHRKVVTFYYQIQKRLEILIFRNIMILADPFEYENPEKSKR